MRRLAAAILAIAAISGCAGGQAALTGHDFIAEAAAALSVGLGEYHRQDAQRLALARRQAAEAFAADVIAAGSAANSPGAAPQTAGQLTDQLIELLERIDRASAIETERLRRMEDWLDKLVEVNASLRQRAEWRLRVDGQMGSYLSALREKAYGQRSAFTPD